MSMKRDALRALHDDPVGRLRREAEEKRSKSPRVKAFLRHREEDRALGQGHHKESLELADKHRRARNAENEVSRPKPAGAEEKREQELKSMRAKHGKEDWDLSQRHERELNQIKD